MKAASARKKLQRARERNGEFVVGVVLNNQIIEGMIDADHLQLAESEDRKQIAEAIHDLLNELFPSSENSVTRGQPNAGKRGLLINSKSTDEIDQ